jgi:hypothetical protein
MPSYSLEFLPVIERQQISSKDNQERAEGLLTKLGDF